MLLSPVELGVSNKRWLLVCTLALLGIVTVWLMALSRYPLAAIPVSLTVSVALSKIAPDPAQGLTLYWRNGIWLIGWGKDLVPASLRPCAVCLPWVMRLTFDCSAQSTPLKLLIFNDCAELAALKRLRRWVVLEH